MNKKISIAITIISVIIAILILFFLFTRYWLHPWTRDGQVQALVVQITPRVSGPINTVHITDNQKVKKGDLLFTIDPRTFEAKVQQEQSLLEQSIAKAAEAKEEAARVERIYKRNREAISYRKLTSTEHSREAAIAAVEGSKAALRLAQLDLEFTKIYAPVDGYVTNLSLQIGDQVVTNQPAIALVDSNSFWIYGFFKETQIKHIQKNDKAIVQLMSYRNRQLKGTVESLGWGITRDDGTTGTDLLINVNPSFDWIRLAQRIPVVIHLEEIPEEVALRVGMTASVFIKH